MADIGISFENVTVEEVVSNYKFYASQLLDKKIISFRGIELDKYSHHDFLYLLSNGGPPDEEMENFIESKNLENNLELIKPMGGGDDDDTVSHLPGRGHVISKRRHVNLGANFLSLDKAQEFFEWSIHVDTPLDGLRDEVKSLQAYTSMHMSKFDYPEGVGSTYFTSMIDMFEKFPKELIRELYSATVEEWRKSGDKIEKCNLWPALHKHPFTGESIFFYPGWNSIISLSHEITHEVAIEIQNWVRDYFLDEENWYTWSWRKNDFIMWDNRSLAHRFEGGWIPEKRIFSQGGFGGFPPERLIA